MQLLKALISLTMVLIASSETSAAKNIPIPQVSGPVPTTPDRGESYRGSNEQPVPGPGLPMPDLERVGYVQEEFVISGTIDGKPYRTSLLVRRPKDLQRFSGLVGVETIHAGGAIPFWGTGREVWAPGGHGWVAVASQRAALENRVKKFNPARYASLYIPEAPAGANGMMASPQDAISQAIMTQVGMLLKSNRKSGPFGGAKVRYLLMGGSSQTGGTTLRYIEQSHAAARLPNGKPIYDGYMPMEAFSATRIEGGDAAVIHAVGEGDFALFRAGNPQMMFSSREDADAPRDRFREYQFAAASHVPTRGRNSTDRPGEYPSQFPTQPFYKMSLLHLIDWVTMGTVPPRGPRLEQTTDGVMQRDEHGNVKGGIRSPWVDVPSARIIAAAPIAPGDPNTRAQQGVQENFSPAKLAALYGTREAYLARFNAGLDALVAARWITTADGARYKSEEAAKPPF
ncbi:alpha/beta hydrolase domain-containing protein [Novosphingobium aquae]|uniref:Alpha/beta hydrolase domain-containing protein n=1 Tax=Novosphingobium aquae TaxID=3133435 RepID=A0ABU8SE11_9SPHN